MKFASLLVIMLLAASCGKESSSGSASSKQAGRCDLNGRSVACESIRGADGLGIDLLESMIDVPVQVSNSEIVFQEDKDAVSQGRRIECRTTVKNGEIYRYTLRGNALHLSTDTGTYEMERLNSGDGLLGTWKWNGYVDEGTHVIRQLSFLGNSRVIIRTSCEL
jgi:hypothetical protein